MPVTGTAQAITTLLNAKPADLITLALSVVAALLALAIANQAILEGFISKAIPGAFFWVKPFLPTITSSILGAIASRFANIPGVDAAAGAAVLAGFTHAWNSTPWAASLESKTSSILPLVLLACLLGLPKASMAAESLGYGALGGTSTWNFGPGGKLMSTGSTLAGGQMEFGFGSLSGTTFSPDAVVVLGGAYENQNGSQYADLVFGAGPIIPGTEQPLVFGPAWRLFGGQPYPALAVWTTFNFGQPFWIHK